MPIAACLWTTRCITSFMRIALRSWPLQQFPTQVMITSRSVRAFKLNNIISFVQVHALQPTLISINQHPPQGSATVGSNPVKDFYGVRQADQETNASQTTTIVDLLP
jgi:hypothetical protein